MQLPIRPLRGGRALPVALRSRQQSSSPRACWHGTGYASLLFMGGFAVAASRLRLRCPEHPRPATQGDGLSGHIVYGANARSHPPSFCAGSYKREQDGPARPVVMCQHEIPADERIQDLSAFEIARVLSRNK